MHRNGKQIFKNFWFLFLAATNFLKQCSKNHRFQQYRLTARPLELTNIVKVENIPAATSSEFLTLYFESPKHGGGQVSDIQMLPTEDSALVKFGDSQGNCSIFTQKEFDTAWLQIKNWCGKFGHITALGLMCAYQ